MRARARADVTGGVRAGVLSAAIAVCALFLLLSGRVYAQDPEAEEAPAAAPAEAAPAQPAANRNCGGLPIASGAINAVQGWFGRGRSVLGRIRPGPHCSSSQALGLERDIDNRRALREGLIQLPEFTEYANGLLERIKEASKLTDIPGSVYVAADLDFNAVTSADGNIYLSIGVLRTIKSEDALVALLAHELAHVVLGHHESDIFVTLQKQLQMVGATVATLRRGVESYARTGNANGTLTPRDNQLLQRVQIAIAVSDGILHPGWNRRQELEADRLAVDLTQALGYSYGTGMQGVLSHIAAAEEKRNTAAAEQRQQLQEASPGDLGKQLGGALKDLLDMLGRKHDDAAVRQKSLDAYYDQIYRDAPPQGKRVSQFDEVKDSPAVTAMLEAFEGAFKADRMLTEGQTREALAMADRAAGRRGVAASHAYPLLVLARALRAAGQLAAANTTLARSTTATEPVLKSHIEHASFMARAGRRDAAFSAVEQAFESFRKAPNAYPEVIRFYVEFGEKDRAKKLVSECVTTLPAIRESCAQQGKGI